MCVAWDEVWGEVWCEGCGVRGVHGVCVLLGMRCGVRSVHGIICVLFVMRCLGRCSVRG